MNENAETPAKKYASFEEFWPDYVRAHQNKTNRQLHFIGSTLGALCAVGGVLKRRPLLLLAAPVVGYGFAWVGHFVFEKNSPASFTHPIYSFKADWLMWSKIASGTMDAEVERFTHGAVEVPEASNGASAGETPPADATVN